MSTIEIFEKFVCQLPNTIRKFVSIKEITKPTEIFPSFEVSLKIREWNETFAFGLARLNFEPLFADTIFMLNSNCTRLVIVPTAETLSVHEAENNYAVVRQVIFNFIELYAMFNSFEKEIYFLNKNLK